MVFRRRIAGSIAILTCMSLQVMGQEIRCTYAEHTQVRVVLADALGNPPPNSRFVVGQDVVARVIVSDLLAIDARQRADEAELGRARARATAREDKASVVRGEGTGGDIPRLREVVDRLTVRATWIPAGGRDAIHLPATIVHVADTGASLARRGVVESKQITSTNELGDGVLRFELVADDQDDRLNCTIGGRDGTAEVRVDIVGGQDATALERCWVAQVEAQLALEASDYKRAIEAAQRAIDADQTDSLYRLGSLRHLGDAFAATGRLAEAVDAYERALAMADRTFPKSRIRATLEPVITALQFRASK